MNRTTLKILAIFTFIVAFTTFAAAQAPERVKLTQESPALVWEKSVAAGGSKMYVVALKKGQQIKLGFIEDSKQGSVDFGKASLEEGVDFHYDVEVTKDYMISVSNSGTRSTSFRIFLSLENAGGGSEMDNGVQTTEPSNEIDFQGGEWRTTRTIKPGEKVKFTFMGEVGLVAHVKVDDPSVTLQVDFCDRMLALNEDETCKLSREGEWSIDIANLTKTARKYTLTASVDANPPQEDGGLDEVKINFPKGDTDTYVEGTVGAEGSKMFLFNARKGQKLTFAVFDDTNKLQVNFNKNPRQLNADVKYVLNASGEWAIYVDNPTKRAVKYRLYIQIL